jgi:hypothetical protein
MHLNPDVANPGFNKNPRHAEGASVPGDSVALAQPHDEPATDKEWKFDPRSAKHSGAWKRQARKRMAPGVPLPRGRQGPSDVGGKSGAHLSPDISTGPSEDE